MRKVRFYCEDCEMYFHSLDELELMIVIGGDHDVLCCPNCQGVIEITIEKQNM